MQNTVYVKVFSPEDVQLNAVNFEGVNGKLQLL